MNKLLLVLALTTSFAYADHHEEAAAGENFEEMKKKALEHVDKRIGMLNEMKSCISAASKKEDMKPCREKFKDEHHSMKSEMGAERIKRQEMRLQKMKEKQEEMNKKK